MKEHFKKLMSQHKGQPLDSKLIQKIASEVDELFREWLTNEDLCLLNRSTGIKIDSFAEEKNFRVMNAHDWNDTKEYTTLNGAIKASNDSTLFLSK